MTNDNQGLITNDDLTVTILYKRFQHHYSYEAPISTVGGVVSGGGTKTKSYWSWGYEIKVKNTAATTRYYGFKFALFKNVESRDVDHQFNRLLEDVKPGYTKSIDIDLGDDDLNKLYLEDIYVSDTVENVRLAHHPQFCSMAAEANRNITPEQRRKAAIKQYLLIGIPVLLLLAIIAAFLIFYGNEQNELHERVAQIQISNTEALKVAAIDARMRGDWICVGENGIKSDRMTVGYNTLSQGGAVVTLLPHTGLVLDRNTLQKVPLDAASSYLNPLKGTAIQLTSLSNTSLKLENYVSTPGSGSYKVEIYICSRG